MMNGWKENVMNKQIIQFAVRKTDSVITQTGRSYITHPKIQFNRDGIKWYADKPKQKNESKNG